MSGLKKNSAAGIWHLIPHILFIFNLGLLRPSLVNRENAKETEVTPLSLKVVFFASGVYPSVWSRRECASFLSLQEEVAWLIEDIPLQFTPEVK